MAINTTKKEANFFRTFFAKYSVIQEFLWKEALNITVFNH